VCAENQFVVLKYNTKIEEVYDTQVLQRHELDATPLKGITLFANDLGAVGIGLGTHVLTKENDNG
jgi:hypothetical protein